MRRPTGYMMDMVIFPNDQMDKYEEYMKEYGLLSDRQLYRELARVKGEVSQEVIDQHIKNLDAFANMQGFVSDEHKQRMERVKLILSSQGTTATLANAKKSNVQSEFFFGSGLLLWFLALAAIWRRPCYGYPCQPYPYY